MPEESILDKTRELFPDENFKEMVEAGVFYGRKKSKTHPKMKPYVLTNRGGLEIINLHKTQEDLKKVCDFVREKVREGGLAFLVGTQPAAGGIQDLAKKFGFPYVVNRWLGGTLTNFKVISKRIEYFRKLRKDWDAGAFEKYTKKERVKLEGEIRRLTELMGGLENFNRLPDFIIIIDPSIKNHKTAIREANRIGIPVVTLADVDSDPEGLDYFVVGNNKARKSIGWFLGKIEGAIEEGKNLPPPTQVTSDQEPQKEIKETPPEITSL